MRQRAKREQLLRRVHLPSPFRKAGLQVRITISYVCVTIGSILTFLTLGVGLSFIVKRNAEADLPNKYLPAVQRQAYFYALKAEVQAGATALNPQSSFIPTDTDTLSFSAVPDDGIYLSIPYAPPDSLHAENAAFALLIAPDGTIVASSNPRNYPAHVAVSTLLAGDKVAIVQQALHGTSNSAVGWSGNNAFVYAAQTVQSRDSHVLGAIFVQVPGPERTSFFAMLRGLLLINLGLLIVVTPIGVLFGIIATRGLVKRVRNLAQATTYFAEGDYTQRVTPQHDDEIGQLERQFNQMAEQLVENITRRQELAERNARLEERSRISRELHDAVSQNLFSLRMLADGMQEASRAGASSSDLAPQIAVLAQTTGEMTREMRALLLELRPTQLEHLGLIGALEQLAHAYSTRLGITVTTDLRPVNLDVKIEHALLRLTQEALANAARHASATIISICLVPSKQAVELTITDNGRGFDPAACEQRHGLGLGMMLERVQELQGILNVEAAPGQGTRIHISLLREALYDQSLAGR